MLVAQLDRVTGYEPVGRGFESLQARQSVQLQQYKNHAFAWFLFMQNQAYGIVYQLFHTLFLLLIFDVWEVNVY